MIEIKNVTFHYSGLDQAGLSDFNLSVTDGECILLCGASGCGNNCDEAYQWSYPPFFQGRAYRGCLCEWIRHQAAGTL